MNVQCELSEVRQVAPASPPAAPSRWRARTPVIAAALIGLVWSGFASYFVWKWETGVARQELELAADGHFLALQNGLNEYLNKLIALRTFFEASEDISREEFETFGTRLLQGQKAVQNFSWVPLVSRAERAVMSIWRAGKESRSTKSRPSRSTTRSSRRRSAPSIFRSTTRRSSAERASTASICCRSLIIRNRLEPRPRQQSVVGGPGIRSCTAGTGPFMASCSRCRSIAAHMRDRHGRAAAGASARIVHGAFQTAEAIDFILKTGTTAARPRYLSLSRRCGAGCRATSRHRARACGRRRQSPSRGRSCTARPRVRSRCTPATRAGPWLRCRYRTARSRPGTTAPGLCCLPACSPAPPLVLYCARRMRHAQRLHARERARSRLSHSGIR